MAMARVLAGGAHEETMDASPPRPVDVFWLMQVQLQELETILAIIGETGKKNRDRAGQSF